jgi:pimeloyl-ACP methyl ester carboxylesterase
MPAIPARLTRRVCSRTAAVAFLQRRGIAPERLVLMGASLGTGVATRLAAERAPAALVLVSGFTSLPDAGAAALPLVPVRLLMRDRFDNLGTIPQVHAPVLVLHATDDRIIPFAQGEALAKATPGGRLVRFAGYGHQLQFTAPAQDAAIAWLAGLHL